MPSYNFRNKKTGKVFEKVMKMSEREDYLKDNPDIEQMLSTPAFRYGVNNTQGVKVDDGFREIQQKAAENHPAHNMKML